MVFDSHSTRPPSTSTGTMAFGFSARNAGCFVDWNPEPQSSRTKGAPSSAQVHKTLRTLIELAFPRMRSMSPSTIADLIILGRKYFRCRARTRLLPVYSAVIHNFCYDSEVCLTLHRM